MITNELLEGVRKSLTAGKTRPQIEQEMLANNWSRTDIDQVFNLVNRKGAQTNKYLFIVILILPVVLYFLFYYVTYVRIPPINQKYTDSEFGFSLVIPSGYTVRNLIDKPVSSPISKTLKVIGFSRAPSKSHIVMVAAVEDPVRESSSEAITTYTTESFANDPTYKELGYKNLNVDGNPSRIVHFLMEELSDTGDRREMENQVLTISKNDLLYVFYTGWAASYRQGKKISDTVLSSVDL